MLALDTQAKGESNGIDVIEVCKTIMIGVLFTGGANFGRKRPKPWTISLPIACADPEYCEAFVGNLRAELMARHGSLH